MAVMATNGSNFVLVAIKQRPVYQYFVVENGSMAVKKACKKA